MASHIIHGEAMKPGRAAGLYAGRARRIKSEICLRNDRTPELNSMRGQSSLHSTLKHTQYGR